jgi:hypothetical protein
MTRTANIIVELTPIVFGVLSVVALSCRRVFASSCMLAFVSCVDGRLRLAQAFWNARRKIEMFWLIWLIIITLSATDYSVLAWLTVLIFFSLLFIADIMFLNDSFIYDPTANAQVCTADAR